MLQETLESSYHRHFHSLFWKSYQENIPTKGAAVLAPKAPEMTALFMNLFNIVLIVSLSLTN
jgi:hypothetical protein